MSASVLVWSRGVTAVRKGAWRHMETIAFRNGVAERCGACPMRNHKGPLLVEVGANQEQGGADAGACNWHIMWRWW
jgi:hypothetical protein